MMTTLTSAASEFVSDQLQHERRQFNLWILIQRHSCDAATLMTFMFTTIHTIKMTYG